MTDPIMMMVNKDGVAARKKGEELYVAPVIEKSGRKESE